MVGQCSCGMFQCQCQNHNSSSSWLFSMPNHTSYDEANMYPFMSSSSSVDCTLSLGTPSTRLCEDDDNKHIRWDLLQQNNNAASYNSHQHTKASRGSHGNSSNNNSSGNDTLLARRCANCDTTSTPLWRNGPRGPKSLCNACGIRFKKEERRANANNNSSMVEQQQQYHGYGYDYDYHHSQNQKMSCFSPLNEFRFIEDNDRDSDTGMPYLSWRLNVADRPASLVHDFTR